MVEGASLSQLPSSQPTKRSKTSACGDADMVYQLPPDPGLHTREVIGVYWGQWLGDMACGGHAPLGWGSRSPELRRNHGQRAWLGKWLRPRGPAREQSSSKDLQE